MQLSVNQPLSQLGQEANPLAEEKQKEQVVARDDDMDLDVEGP